MVPVECEREGWLVFQSREGREGGQDRVGQASSRTIDPQKGDSQLRKIKLNPVHYNLLLPFYLSTIIFKIKIKLSPSLLTSFGDIYIKNQKATFVEVGTTTKSYAAMRRHN